MPKRRSLILGGLALPALVSRAWAQDRPIQLMVGFAPGGNIDLAARMAAPYLEKYLGGQPIVVVNKATAGGLVMLNELAVAPGDGRIVALVSLPALVTALYDKTPAYRTDSFAYVGMLTDEPYTIFAAPNGRYRTLRDMIEAARAKPDEITIAGAGAGSAPHLACMQLERAAGVKFTWVPTTGAGPAMQLVQGGHVTAAISTTSLTVRAHIQGTLRVLAIMDEQRWDRAREIPTAKEQGADASAGSARGIALPVTAPAAVTQRWEDAVRRTAEDTEFRALADRDYLIMRYMDRPTMTRFVERQNAFYGTMWRSTPWIAG